MDRIGDFVIYFLYAAAFCLAATLGILFLFSRRKIASAEQLQKLFGASSLLLAFHLLVLLIYSFFGDISGVFFHYFLVLVDIAACIFCLVFVFRSFQKNNQHIPTRQEPAVEEQTEEKPEAYKEECGEDEGQLENPSVDDLLFFQKVEALMVNEMLFCEQELSREALATAIGTNRTYLARSIKSATGKTFSEYITDLRTAYAAQLLTTSDEPLDLIGTLVGFRSKSAYYRAFSAAYNCSPSEYRKNSVCQQSLQ